MTFGCRHRLDKADLSLQAFRSDGAFSRATAFSDLKTTLVCYLAPVELEFPELRRRERNINCLCFMMASVRLDGLTVIVLHIRLFLSILLVPSRTLQAFLFIFT